MAQTELETQLLAVLEEHGAEHAIDIVDVEVVGSRKAPTVRVRIDHADEGAGPISLDEVAAETGWINQLIDEADPIEGSFTLEVSSPGLSRPLRRRRDFEHFCGSQVSLSTNAEEGRRRFTGTLRALEGDSVLVECEGEELSVALSDIKSCKLKPSFDN